MKEKCNGQSGERKVESGVVESHTQRIGEGQQGLGLIRVGDRPPGDELEQRQFITDPCFHSGGGDELGGTQFISERQIAKPAVKDTAKPSVKNTAPSLADEFLPVLPQTAPLIRRRGPRVLTPEVIDNFCRFLSVGLSRRQAAARLDIDPTTVTKAIKQDRELAALLERSEEIAAGDPVLCLIAASRKSWRAAVRLMELRRNSYEPKAFVDKEEELREDLENRRLELEFEYQTEALEDEYRDKEAARQKTKKEAEEEAWEERERLMIAKEEAEERAAQKKQQRKRKAAASKVGRESSPEPSE